MAALGLGPRPLTRADGKAEHVVDDWVSVFLGPTTAQFGRGMLTSLTITLGEWFEVVPGPAAREAGPVRSALTAAGQKRPALGMVFPGDDRVSLLQLRERVKTPVAGAPAVQRLDVSLLHQLILERVLGIDRAAQEAKTNLDYIKDTQQALDRAREGEGQVLFLMNPTPVSQVRDVADCGEVHLWWRVVRLVGHRVLRAALPVCQVRADGLAVHQRERGPGQEHHEEDAADDRRGAPRASVRR